MSTQTAAPPAHRRARWRSPSMPCASGRPEVEQHAVDAADQRPGLAQACCATVRSTGASASASSSGPGRRRPRRPRPAARAAGSAEPVPAAGSARMQRRTWIPHVSCRRSAMNTVSSTALQIMPAPGCSAQLTGAGPCRSVMPSPGGRSAFWRPFADDPPKALVRLARATHPRSDRGWCESRHRMGAMPADRLI